MLRKTLQEMLKNFNYRDFLQSIWSKVKKVNWYWYVILILGLWIFISIVSKPKHHKVNKKLEKLEAEFEAYKVVSNAEFQQLKNERAKLRISLDSLAKVETSQIETLTESLYNLKEIKREIPKDIDFRDSSLQSRINILSRSIRRSD